MPLAIIGGILIALVLGLWFFSRFGRKGAIAVGSVVLLAGLVMGGVILKRHREDVAWREGRLAEAHRNLALLRAMVTESTSATTPLRQACKAEEFKPTFGSFSPVVLTHASTKDELEILVRDFGEPTPFRLRPGPLLPEGEIEELPHGLEEGLRAELLLVINKAEVFQTPAGYYAWRGTVTALQPRSGKRCAGQVVIDVGGSKGVRREFESPTLLSEICSQAGWDCGRH
ncbi:MAG: hypothetical protein ACYC8T_36405 [Myxococcaceae bacterium]